jgi:hypothetical protein
MNFEISRTDEFSKHLKQLAKKYPSIKNDFAALLESLQQNAQQGSALGKNCYKIRMKIASKKAGKSGGARVITFIKLEYKHIFLLDIYDKSEKGSLGDKELLALLKKVD